MLKDVSSRLHTHKHTHAWLLCALTVDPARRPDSSLPGGGDSVPTMDYYRQLDWRSEGHELVNTRVLLEHHRGMHGEAKSGAVKKYAVTPQHELLFLIQPDGEREYVMMQHREVCAFLFKKKTSISVEKASGEKKTIMFG